MIRYHSQYQLSIEEFRTPFELNLQRENRWVKLASALPWDKLVQIYCRTLSQNEGAPSINPRIIIGALIIKHKQALSDTETIASIQENIYQQYFLGLTQYQPEPVFDPSLFVTIRKRLGAESFDRMVIELIRAAAPEASPTTPPAAQHDVPPPSSPPPLPSDSAEENGLPHRPSPSHQHQESSTMASSSSPSVSSEEPLVNAPSLPPPNAGLLIADMTVAPADISYPTDVELLNTAREQSEELIDLLHRTGTKPVDYVKPRTYRQKARKEYLQFAKGRKKSQKTYRKAIRKQLGFLGRNIKSIHALLDLTPDGLTGAAMRMFWIIQELYRQQQEMYQTKTHRIADRIVSVFQPHVRPIVRGKAKAKTEFGAQVSLSVMNGYSRIHRIVWDAYDEGGDLPNQLEDYYAVYGYYPAVVLTDKKYATKENIAYMKARGIHYGGSPRGRRNVNDTIDVKLSKEILNQRNHIEGKFGTGKRTYGLDCIRARRADTSESWIASIFFVMNLALFLKSWGGSFLFFCSVAWNQWMPWCGCFPSLPLMEEF